MFSSDINSTELLTHLVNLLKSFPSETVWTPALICPVLGMAEPEPVHTLLMGLLPDQSFPLQGHTVDPILRLDDPLSPDRHHMDILHHVHL